MNRIAVLICVMFMLSVINSGCRSGHTYQRKYYLIQAGKPSKNEAMIDAIVKVGRFEIDRSFGTRNLVYYYGNNRFETDFYNVFMTVPDVIIAEQTRKWLDESGLFKAVMYYGVVTPSYEVKAYVEKLYGDYSDRDSPKAVMEIRYYLLGADRDGKIVFTELYRSAVKVSSNSASDLVASYGKCLDEILTKFSDDLSTLELQEAAQ